MIEFALFRPIGLAHREFVEPGVERHVSAQGRELLRKARLCRLFSERLARALGLHIDGVGKQVLQIAPLEDQLGGALLANSLHTWNVVARVTDECPQVEDLLWRHTKAFLDLSRPKASLLDPVHQRHAIGDQLHQILVTGHDDDARVGGRRRDQGRDHIIRLEVLHLEDGDAMGFDQLAHERHLDREIFRLGVAVRLVVWEQALAKAAATRVHRDDHEVGALFADHLAEHVHETERGIGRGAVRRLQPGDREERAIDRVGAVDDDQLASGFRQTVWKPTRIASHLPPSTSPDELAFGRTPSRARIRCRESTSELAFGRTPSLASPGGSWSFG